MALRNPETVARLLDRMTGSMKNLRLMVKSQRPVEDFIKQIENTEDLIDQLTSTLEREGSPLRNG
jgi:acetolactate synthase regulatory subunit